jgi:hypothetical protein
VFRGSQTAVEIEGFPKDIALRGRRASPKNTVPSDKNGFPARCPLIPYRPANRYRTLRQKIPYSPTKNTVLSDKFAPPLGADLPGSESRFDKSPANAAIISRKSIRRAIPYSPTRNTVLSDKEYRTLRQGIPYSPTRNTVLSDKEYRTVQQNIPYSPTKWVRDVPAKGRKNVGGRFVRPVCVYC